MPGITRFDDLVGDDVPAGELERLRPVDALLRSIPGPPPVVPRLLTIAIERMPHVLPQQPWEAEA